MRAEIREVKGLLLLRRLLSCSAAAWHFVCMAREAESTAAVLKDPVSI